MAYQSEQQLILVQGEAKGRILFHLTEISWNFGGWGKFIGNMKVNWSGKVTFNKIY